MSFLTLGALKVADDPRSRGVAAAGAAGSSGAEVAGVAARGRKEEQKEHIEDKKTGRKQYYHQAEGGQTANSTDHHTSATTTAAFPTTTTPSLLSTSSAFLEQMTSKVSSYATACRTAASLGDWMTINNQYFGSSVLYTDEISTGLLFGYCAGYAFNRALRFGALLCGIGFISLQTLHHFGYIQVNWKRVEEDIKRPLDLNGDGKVDQEDVAAFQRRVLKFMAQGVPSTAGLSLGLLWGLRAGR